jgi:hypothetical protein
VLQAGGTYRLVLGADLNNSLVQSRREALEEQAAALGIEVRAGMFEVLNASDLADWAEQHLALAVSPLLNGIGTVAQPFSAWAASNQFTDAWVNAPSRERIARTVSEFVTDAARVDLHIEGVSGLGKTRTVLEAIRGQEYEPLVAYVDAADALPAPLIQHLQVQVRHTVLVIDECGAERHKRLVETATGRITGQTDHDR